MASLFRQLLCASFLAATAAMGAETADVFAIAKAAFGLEEEQFIESTYRTYPEGKTWLLAMIQKETLKKITELESRHVYAHSFLAKLLAIAREVAAGRKKRDEASAYVNKTYNALSTDDKRAIQKILPSFETIFCEKEKVKPEGGDIDEPWAKKELQEMKRLLKRTNVKGFSKTIQYIEILLETKPGSWTEGFLKDVLDPFSEEVKTLAGVDEKTLTDVAVDNVIQACKNFCKAMFATEFLTKDKMTMLEKILENTVEPLDTRQKKLKELESYIGKLKGWINK